MRWRVMIELTSGDGAVHAREVATGSDDSAGSAVKPLGLTLADAKALLAAIQRHLVQAEVADYCRERLGSNPAVAALHRGARSRLLRRSWRTVAPLSMSASWPNWARGCHIVVHATFWRSFSRSVTTCPRWRRSDNEHSKSAPGWNEKRCRRRSVRRRRNQRRR